jgi:hypothetical protein
MMVWSLHPVFTKVMGQSICMIFEQSLLQCTASQLKKHIGNAATAFLDVLLENHWFV